MDGAGSSNIDKSTSEANGDLKRKKSELVSEAPYPNKSPKNVQGTQKSSPSYWKGLLQETKRLKPAKIQNNR